MYTCTCMYMYNVYMYIHVLYLWLCRVKAVKTTEELSDVYAHFSLYYGRDLVDMQHLKTMQRRQGDTEDQVRGHSVHEHACSNMSYVFNCVPKLYTHERVEQGLESVFPSFSRANSLDLVTSHPPLSLLYLAKTPLRPIQMYMYTVHFLYMYICILHVHVHLYMSCELCMYYTVQYTCICM